MCIRASTPMTQPAPAPVDDSVMGRYPDLNGMQCKGLNRRAVQRADPACSAVDLGDMQCSGWEQRVAWTLVAAVHAPESQV